jgi:hypothetical protein
MRFAGDLPGSEKKTFIRAGSFFVYSRGKKISVAAPPGLLYHTFMFLNAEEDI